MDSKSPNLDLWMEDALNNWADQGVLSAERSAQLHTMVTNMALQERQNHFTRKVFEIVAAIITCIWLLFASCPVAAASYVGNTRHLTHFSQVDVFALLLIICFCLNNQIQSQIKNRNFEVNYE